MNILLPVRAKCVGIFICALVVGAIYAHSADDDASRRAKAGELYVVMVAPSVQTNMHSALDSLAQKFRDAPAPVVAEGRALVDASLKQVIEDYRAFFVRSYAARFTTEELQQLVTLMRISQSPLMAKLDEHQKSFKPDSDQVLKEIMNRMSKELTPKIEQLVLRHRKQKG